MNTFDEAKEVFERAYFKQLFKTYPNAPLRDLMKIAGINSTAHFYRLIKRTGIEVPKYGSEERPYTNKGKSDAST